MQRSNSVYYGEAPKLPDEYQEVEYITSLVLCTEK